MYKGQYNGQTKAEYQKNFKRVNDIITKSLGDEDKIVRLSQTQARLIKDEWKAINRANVAKRLLKTLNITIKYIYIIYRPNILVDLLRFMKNFNVKSNGQK
jgi:hypothetical protein